MRRTTTAIIVSAAIAGGLIAAQQATAQSSASASPGAPYYNAGYARTVSLVSSNYAAGFKVTVTLRIFLANGRQLGGARGYAVRTGIVITNTPVRHSVRCSGTVTVRTFSQLTVRRPDGSIIGRQVRYSPYRTLRCRS
jgi:hypothetical protein